MKEGMPGSVELSSSRAGLDQVCALLMTPSPEALDAAAAILGRVVADVAEAGRRVRSGAAAEAEEYRGIRRGVRRARILLEKASAYHAGWAAWLGSFTSGYGPGGAAQAPVARGRLSIEG
jgi:hypothetical protein